MLLNHMFRNRAIRASFAGVILLASAAPVMADVKAGVDAWGRGDYAAAVKEWQGPAERGDADAQFNLGQAYKLGRGVKPNLAKAEELFEKAAARGHLQASDNLGLLLFQRGERARGLPFIRAAADRGDARAQYLLGIAHFNGDNVAKDWVRAYALVSLAQQAGLPQAAPSLAQMDQYISLEDRQRSVALASELSARAQATRDRQLAAIDLGAPSAEPAAAARPPVAAALPPRSTGPESPRTAGADYARPRPPVAVASPRPQPTIAATRPALPPALPPARVALPSSLPPAVSGGAWRVQLGAFGVASNADAMWNRVRNRPEIAGHARLMVPAGKAMKLQAGGYASQADAQSACARLSAAGISCLAVRN